MMPLALFACNQSVKSSLWPTFHPLHPIKAVFSMAYAVVSEVLQHRLTVSAADRILMHR